MLFDPEVHPLTPLLQIGVGTQGARSIRTGHKKFGPLVTSVAALGTTDQLVTRQIVARFNYILSGLILVKAFNLEAFEIIPKLVASFLCKILNKT